MTVGIADFIRDLQISGGGKGLAPADKQALIDIANSADANNDVIKTDVVNKLKTMNPALTITTASDWAAIRAAIATMPNNGSLTYTPGTAARAIPAGYTSGGTVDGDPDLVPANIKSGANIFGVAGKNEVLDTTTGAGAAAADVLTGKEVFVNGTKRVGTMVNRSGVLTGVTDNSMSRADGIGDLELVPPPGYYDGSSSSRVKTWDADFLAANIRAGVDIFGLLGTYQQVQQASGSVQITGNNPYSVAISGLSFRPRVIVGRMDYAKINGTVNGTEIWVDNISGYHVTSYGIMASALVSGGVSQAASGMPTITNDGFSVTNGYIYNESYGGRTYWWWAMGGW